MGDGYRWEKIDGEWTKVPDAQPEAPAPQQAAVAIEEAPPVPVAGELFVCIGCHAELPADRFYVSKRDGRLKRCKGCFLGRQAELREEHDARKRAAKAAATAADVAPPLADAPPRSTKRCQVCQVDLPLGKFYVDRSGGRETRRNRCKTCEARLRRINKRRSTDDDFDDDDGEEESRGHVAPRNEAITALFAAVTRWTAAKTVEDQDGATAAVLLRCRQVLDAEQLLATTSRTDQDEPRMESDRDG